MDRRLVRRHALQSRRVAGLSQGLVRQERARGRLERRQQGTCTRAAMEEEQERLRSHKRAQGLSHPGDAGGLHGRRRRAGDTRSSERQRCSRTRLYVRSGRTHRRKPRQRFRRCGTRYAACLFQCTLHGRHGGLAQRCRAARAARGAGTGASQVPLFKRAEQAGARRAHLCDTDRAQADRRSQRERIPGQRHDATRGRADRGRSQESHRPRTQAGGLRSAGRAPGREPGLSRARIEDLAENEALDADKADKSISAAHKAKFDELEKAHASLGTSVLMLELALEGSYKETALTTSKKELKKSVTPLTKAEAKAARAAIKPDVAGARVEIGKPPPPPPKFVKQIPGEAQDYEQQLAVRAPDVVAENWNQIAKLCGVVVFA